MQTHNPFVGVDAALSLYDARPFFTKRCGKLAIAPTGGQGRPPLQNVVCGRRSLCVFVGVFCAGGASPPPHYDETSSQNANSERFFVEARRASDGVSWIRRVSSNAASAEKLRCQCWLSHTSSTAISLGLTPEMRLACPTDRGRMSLSFCCASMRSPEIFI